MPSLQIGHNSMVSRKRSAPEQLGPTTPSKQPRVNSPNPMADCARKATAQTAKTTKTTKNSKPPNTTKTAKVTEPTSQPQSISARWKGLTMLTWDLLADTVTSLARYPGGTAGVEPATEEPSLDDSSPSSSRPSSAGFSGRASSPDAPAQEPFADSSSPISTQSSISTSLSAENTTDDLSQIPTSQTFPFPNSVTTPPTPPLSQTSSEGSTLAPRSNASFNASPAHHSKRRAHIFEKRFKQNTINQRQLDREALIAQVYEARKRAGYAADLQTFKGFLAYQQTVENAARADAFSPSPSLTDLRSRVPPTPRSRRFSETDTNAFIRQALQKALATLNGPQPPKVFTPSFEQRRLSDRTKDQHIEDRLRPKPTPLPSSLPPEDELEVAQLLKQHGLISKFAREQVSSQDIVRLRPGQWLNDEIINFYGAMILARSDECKENSSVHGGKGKQVPLKVHYFSTFFWPKLRNEGYEKGRLAKWTKKVDLFSKDVVLIPVNHSNAHWTAAAINFRQKRIESHDSMGYVRQEVFKQLRAYIDAEHRNKKRQPFDFTGWDDCYAPPTTPLQENGFDCGVFTCQFLESMSRGEDRFNFTQKDMPYLRRRMIWEIGHGTLRDVP